MSDKDIRLDQAKTYPHRYTSGHDGQMIVCYKCHKSKDELKHSVGCHIPDVKPQGVE